MSTPPLNLSHNTFWRMPDDLPFLKVRYMDDFGERLDSRQFALVLPSGEGLTIGDA